MLGLVRRLLGIAPPTAEVPAAQWQRVERALPFLDHLPAADRVRLREMALEFLRRKEFHGAQGLQLDDDMLLAIALQACLPVLHIGLQAYDGWVGVVVYPGDFLVPRRTVDEAGVLHEYDDEVLGEAWEGGPVLLSWFEGENPFEGINVVIHEFAHQLDQENGAAQGAPPPSLGDRQHSAQRWSQVFHAAYAQLQSEVHRGHHGLLSHYGAQNPAEFFAVVSEVFFEQAQALAREYPALYQELRGYYTVDPAQW